MDNNEFPGSETLAEMVRSVLIREEDYRATKFRKYFEIAKDVFRELNLYSIRWTKRYFLEVNPNSKSVTIPGDCILLSSVQVIHDGKIIPLILNNNIHEEFVDIAVEASCGCKCGCQSEICGQVKNYEVIYGVISAPMPDGSIQSFNTYSRKTIYPNGDYYHEYTIPETTYEDQEIISTELVEKKEFICKLETKECGCVVDCESNKNDLDACCGPNTFSTECGCNIYKENCPSLTYGHEKFSDRIEFDSDFPYKHVLIRCFINEKGNNIRVPLVAKMALVYGIMAQVIPFERVSGYSALAQQRRQNQFNILYAQEKKKLFRLLNRMSLRTFLRAITPNRKMV